jgi:hypothetical protein
LQYFTAGTTALKDERKREAKKRETKKREFATETNIIKVKKGGNKILSYF